MDKNIYAVIHGHFYQPPRENPWLGVIERQASAYPYHDWNERIAAECYTPNTVSRILDPQGRIDAIANNFEYLSFDIGPTLFSWLETHSPRTYRRIIDADRASRDRNAGHGNAIAHAYSHMIMPLANDDDLDTQVIWGIKDFRRRFQRDPEGMWLPETAMNNRAMAALQRHGIRFTILAPSQAQAVRPIGDGASKDVSDGSIDTKRVYRYFIRDEAGGVDKNRFVDVFFFDEPISRAMSFEHLMTNAGRFAETLARAATHRKEAQVINAATDGETFGHHEPFADMCLASFFDSEAPQRGLKVVNYANYLDIAPPAMAVDLKPGPNGEGTAWSCAHGTGRWQRNCGCRTGGPAWWNQQWRTPLRKAFDNLRAGLDAAFENGLVGLVEDPKAARNDYIDVVLERNHKAAEAFLDSHVRKGGAPADRLKVHKLLESQKHAMYMYTSCGWFFAELSGLEPVQNMMYAARAVELAADFTDEPLMQALLSDLAEAHSNIAEMKDGRNVFRRLVWPSMMTMDKVVAATVMSALVTKNGHIWQSANYSVETVEVESLPDKYLSNFGLAKCTNRLTCEGALFAYFVTQFTARDVRCYVKHVADSDRYEAIRDRLQVADKSKLPEVFEGNFISWSDLLPEVAAQIMSVLVESDLEGLRDHFGELFQQNKDLFEALVRTGMELPYEIRGLVKYSLSRLMHDEVLEHRGDWTSTAFARAKGYAEDARNFGVDIDTRDIDALVTEDLLAEAEAVRGNLSPRHFANVISILEIGKELGLSLRRDLAENIILEVLEDKVAPWIKTLCDPARGADDYKAIVQILEYAEKLNFSPRRYKALLADFEAKSDGGH